jgi:ADP-ribose pyrophosphatase YjhB (NUDIX family)
MSSRELREERRAELVRADLLGVIENLFDFEGRAHHEVVFVYESAIGDATLYERARHDVLDTAAQATWVPLADFASGGTWLVPDGLVALIAKHSP